MFNFNIIIIMFSPRRKRVAVATVPSGNPSSKQLYTGWRMMQISVIALKCQSRENWSTEYVCSSFLCPLIQIFFIQHRATSNTMTVCFSQLRENTPPTNTTEQSPTTVHVHYDFALGFRSRL